MKLKTKIVRWKNKYRIKFSIGVQTFTLAYKGKRKECQWMIGCLKEAFKNYKK